MGHRMHTGGDESDNAYWRRYAKECILAAMSQTMHTDSDESDIHTDSDESDIQTDSDESDNAY